jgi:hypothetical protein
VARRLLQQGDEREMSNHTNYRVAIAVVSLLAGCSFEFHDRLMRAGDHRPVVADVLLAVVTLGAGVAFASKAQQDTRSCYASSTDILDTWLFCPVAGVGDQLIAGAFTTAAFAFAMSAVYGQLHYNTASREHADQLTGRTLAAAGMGDCGTADAVASEIEDLNRDTYDLLVADPVVRVCVQRGCAARRETVFERARAADNDAQRIAILRDLPTCEL